MAIKWTTVWSKSDINLISHYDEKGALASVTQRNPFLDNKQKLFMLGAEYKKLFFTICSDKGYDLFKVI